jgi:RNA polymerase sigma-54 factor
MQAELELRPTAAFTMRPSTALVSFTEMLALPGAALEARIERELAENPALEHGRRGVCPLCGGLSASGCRLCTIGTVRPAGDGRAPDAAGADGLELPAQPSAADELRAELRPLVAAADRPIVDYLIASLDGHGRLDAEPTEIAVALGVAPRRVARVLRALQLAGPPGVGARDLRECLLLQLDRVEDPAGGPPLVRAIVEHHLAALGAGRYRAVADATGQTVPEVIAARDYIRSSLRPYPLAEPTPLDHRVGRRSTPCVRPDVLILDRPAAAGEFEVLLVEPSRFALAVSPSYRDLAASAPGGSAERRHAQVHLGRAQLFLSRLQQRWRTMLRVAECVATRQERFLRDGTAFLESLTRAEVAADLGLHESTVCRAVADRYAQLPSGRVMPMAGFFGVSPGLHEALKQVVAAERRPMSDAELARALARRGYPVARRTVAKHRRRLGIPPVPLR